MLLSIDDRQGLEVARDKLINAIEVLHQEEPSGVFPEWVCIKYLVPWGWWVDKALLGEVSCYLAEQHMDVWLYEAYGWKLSKANRNLFRAALMAKRALLLGRGTQKDVKHYYDRVRPYRGRASDVVRRALFKDPVRALAGQCETIIPHSLAYRDRPGPSDAVLALQAAQFILRCVLQVVVAHIEAKKPPAVRWREELEEGLIESL